jgi:carbonic anhydrase
LNQNILFGFVTEKNYKPWTLINKYVSISAHGHFGHLVLPPENKHYDCHGFHFHAPSEHTIDGKRYDMELHLEF